MATIGIGTEYALHCLLYFVDLPAGATLTAGDIAEFQGVSESYLKKIFTKLKKAGIVRSSIGSKGGYELARPADQISFWDVVVAVEGEINFFECRNIRSKLLLYRNSSEKPKWLISGRCEIHKVMLEAEEKIRTVLQENTIARLSRDVGIKIPKGELKLVSKWFEERAGG
jgi:Rrf2 family protein